MTYLFEGNPNLLRGAAMELIHACWLPDRGEPYAWFEGGFGGKEFFSREFAAGTLYLYLHNQRDRPRQATAFWIDDTPLNRLREQRLAHWWRMLPNPLPPGAVAEVAIRPAHPPTASPTVRIAFDDGSEVRARIPLVAPTVRIETVGFDANRQRAYLILENVDSKRRRVQRVWVDTQEVTRQCQLLDAQSRLGIVPIVLRVEPPLAYGTYHVYRVQMSDGAIAACCVRTGDDWVPLGSYGYPTYVEFAQNGCNGHNSFAPLSKQILDLHAQLAMKAVMIIGDSAPADYMKGHPGLFAYSPMDEPDVGDYVEAKDLPHTQRVGYLAMEMERRCHIYRTADPSKMTLITLNLTYKPANYYIYAPIADWLNPDCYPLTLGTPIKMVYEVVRTARRAAAPRPVSFTYQSCYEEPYDPLERARKRFPRPPTPGEIRLMTLYAIAAGARGLFGYGHHTEPTSKYLHRGSGEFPEVWQAIGEVYRELGLVAPLLAIAHPTTFARADAADVLVSTLIAGEYALLVVINERYTQERHTLRVHPVTTQIRVPNLPWLQTRRAWLVRHSGFEPLLLQRDTDGVIVTLKELDTARLVLLERGDSITNELKRRYEAYQARVQEGVRQVSKG